MLVKAHEAISRIRRERRTDELFQYSGYEARFILKQKYENKAENTRT